MTRIFIDGGAGTTGLRLRDRLHSRGDIQLLELPEELRKNDAARDEKYSEADFVFLCLPDEAAITAAERAIFFGCRIIDCSTAHRIADGWTYGFPELCDTQRDSIKNSDKVAVPGCYASGFIALMRPLTDAKIIKRDENVSFFALSGYTGAGKSGIEQYESPDRDKELKSPRQYALTQSHKHIPEMTRYANLINPPIFSPVICDFPCGMTVTLPIFTDKSAAELLDIYKNHYTKSSAVSRDTNAPVIRIRDFGEPSCGFLGSNNLSGSDAMHIYVTGSDGRYTAIARFDNLGKGASGAAIQCYNIMSGTEETKQLII